VELAINHIHMQPLCVRWEMKWLVQYLSHWLSIYFLLLNCIFHHVNTHTYNHTRCHNSWYFSRWVLLISFSVFSPLRLTSHWNWLMERNFLTLSFVPTPTLLLPPSLSLPEKLLKYQCERKFKQRWRCVILHDSIRSRRRCGSHLST
jgi:hypothetical protein